MKKTRMAALTAATWFPGAFVVGGAVLALAPTAGAFDETLAVCPSGYSAVATVDTSCPFADNVHQAWYGQPGNPVYAYSPVTDKIYTMTCGPAVTTMWGASVRCFGVSPGGDPLVVYVD